MYLNVDCKTRQKKINFDQFNDEVVHVLEDVNENVQSLVEKDSSVHIEEKLLNLQKAWSWAT